MSLGIYVHIPFCVRKCPYCDFTSYVVPADETARLAEQERYVRLLLEEAALYQWDKGPVPLSHESLYLGGGTPTCLAGGQLFHLLQSLQQMFVFLPDAEITAEANPGTVDREKLERLKEGGVNRLSIGIQSFSVGELQALGRIHSPQDVSLACRLARQAGFTNISLDLMYGLPGQTIKDWKKNLQAAVALSPEHLSLYQLHIEEGTPFFMRRQKGELQEAAEETARRMVEETIEYLTRQGYHHYEISNFAQPGRMSRHNTLYWQNREYIGLGAGASGYLQGVRYTNEADLAVYADKVSQGRRPTAGEEAIDQRLAMAEQMFLGLRLLEGVNKEIFRQKFGQSLESVYGETLQKLYADGLLEKTPAQVKLTKKGLFLANVVFMEFLP
ncbi:MAG: radical SAM family heme chaperone HemW [Clostridia bacterium]|jgi:oxygen-independent coproporphyrinogen-3 oxidase|nr:radical SAM family heme chaperone HemW [Clostridia bacterium]